MRLLKKVPGPLRPGQLKRAWLSPRSISRRSIPELSAGDSIIIALKRGECILWTKFGV